MYHLSAQQRGSVPHSNSSSNYKPPLFYQMCVCMLFLKEGFAIQIYIQLPIPLQHECCNGSFIIQMEECKTMNITNDIEMTSILYI